MTALATLLDQEIAELRRDVAGWAYLRREKGWGDTFRDFELRDVHALRALMRVRRRAQEPEQADPLTAAKGFHDWQSGRRLGPAFSPHNQRTLADFTVPSPIGALSGSAAWNDWDDER